MDTKIAAVKVHYNATIRRVGMDFFIPTEWSVFCERLQELFGKELQGCERGEKYTITYLDNESDKITISSSPELEEALRTPVSTLHLHVEPKTTENHTTQPSRCQRFSATTCQHRAGRKLACGSAGSVNERAARLLQVGAYDRARGLLVEGIRQHPQNSKLHFYLACARTRLDDLDGGGAALYSAASMGYSELRQCLTEQHLAPLRAHPSFLEAIKDMLQNWKAKGGYAPADIVNETLCDVIEMDTVAGCILAQGLHDSGYPMTHRLYYNLSCLHCACNDVEEALCMMKLAVKAGFNDQNQFLKDDDLLRLRENPQRMNIILRLLNNEPEVPNSSEEEDTVSHNSSSHNNSTNNSNNSLPCNNNNRTDNNSLRSGSSHSESAGSEGDAEEELANNDEGIEELSDDEEAIEIVNDAELVERKASTEWVEATTQLRDMGFDAKSEELEKLLNEHGGNVQEVISILLNH